LLKSKTLRWCRCHIFVEGLYEHYLGDVADSPITRKNYEAELGAGFIYIF
jgi:MipA family protein